ncbi:MAG TPA: ester cyclase [Solirubrobacteraceae bacterium]|nr:ester cyclase [Solirubrobacteraceae bacterium]
MAGAQRGPDPAPPLRRGVHAGHGAAGVLSRVEDLISGFREALGSRDRAAFAKVCASDLHYEDPLCAEPLSGPYELADHVARLWHGFPDARVEETAKPISDGRFVSAPVKLLATHREEVGGFPATGRFVVVHAVLVCELDPRGELLWRVRAFFDVYDAGIQLGVLPRRGGLGERAMFIARGFGLRRLRT